MPHPKQVRGNTWRVQLTTPAGQRVSKQYQAATKKEAMAIARDFQAAVIGGLVTGHAHTLNDAITEWLKNHAPNVQASTVNQYRRAHQRHVAATIGKTKLDQLTTLALDRFYGSLTPDAAGRAHDVIVQALGEAIRWGWINRNPARDAKRPKITRRKMQPPSSAELDRILSELPDTALDGQAALYVKLSAITGARRGEVCALRWSQVDLDVGVVTFDATLTNTGTKFERRTGTKSNDGRSVSIDDATVKALRTLKAERATMQLVSAGPNAYVFSPDEGQSHFNPDYVSRIFRKAARAVGYPGHLHDLRHYHATEMLAAGVSLADLSKRLGHSTPRVTLGVYAHAIPANDRAIADLAAERLRRKSG